MKKCWLLLISLLVVPMFATAAQGSQVKITPLGSHEREFCTFDRAFLFEDPNGTKLVYLTLSGTTIEFDDLGKSTSGCQEVVPSE